MTRLIVVRTSVVRFGSDCVRPFVIEVMWFTPRRGWINLGRVAIGRQASGLDCRRGRLRQTQRIVRDGEILDRRHGEVAKDESAATETVQKRG